MKTSIIAIMALAMSGCASKTSFGKCIGILDQEDPKIEYELSTQNIVIGSIFLASVFVPALVVLKQLKCPVALKAVK